MSAAAEVVPLRSTGQTVGALRAVYLVIEANWTWYKRNWKATVISSIGMPVLYLIAMGVGFGSQVPPNAVTDHLSYLQYLAPALLATGAVQTATGDATFPILSGFKWQKVFFSAASSPITPAQVCDGQLVWITLRLFGSGLAYLAIAAAIGAVTGPGILLSLLFGVLTGLAFGWLVVAYAASMKGESGAGFNPLFRFVLVPMSLFAGTFFPITQLPAWIRPVAWITPLWHGTELARGAEFGTLSLWPTVGHVVYLLALIMVGWALSRWRFRVQLAS
jgi:lipooligosaccharide transport system permease protein